MRTSEQNLGQRQRHAVLDAIGAILGWVEFVFHGRENYALGVVWANPVVGT